VRHLFHVAPFPCIYEKSSKRIHVGFAFAAHSTRETSRDQLRACPRAERKGKKEGRKRSIIASCAPSAAPEMKEQKIAPRSGGTSAAAVHNTDTSLSVLSSAGTAIRMRRLYVLYSVEISRHNYTARDMRCIPPRQERSRSLATPSLRMILTRRGGAIKSVL